MGRCQAADGDHLLMRQRLLQTTQVYIVVFAARFGQMPDVPDGVGIGTIGRSATAIAVGYYDQIHGTKAHPEPRHGPLTNSGPHVVLDSRKVSSYFKYAGVFPERLTGPFRWAATMSEIPY